MLADGAIPAPGTYVVRTPDGDVRIVVSAAGVSSGPAIPAGSYQAIGPDGQVKAVRVLGIAALPSTPETASPADLAFTGSSPSGPVRTAVVLIGVGAIVVMIARHRARLRDAVPAGRNDT